jgi:mannosyl-3-phosphoglycerate phosphatase
LKRKNTKFLVFTDLDGTLLDEKYNYQNITPIISQLLALNVSLVFCSSKTRAEIEFYREKMGINEPFIAENGSAIFIPKNYFPLNYKFTRETASFRIIELGVPYSTVREKLAKIKMITAADIVGFGDMPLEDIAEDTGLTLNLAKLAKKREYDEPFRIVKGNAEEVLSAIEKEGLNCIKSRKFFHLLGNSNKGKAAIILRDLYAQKFGRITTFGAGDSTADLPMLKIVDKPFIVRKTTAENIVWKKILALITKMADKEDKSLTTQFSSS